LPELEYLNANSTSLGDEGMKYVADLKHLKFLNVSNTKITDSGMRELARLGQFQELVAGGLLLNGPNNNEPSDAAVRELGKLKQLRTLDLNNTNFGVDSARAFVGLDQLKTLRVYGTHVTDAGMVELAKLKQLEELAVGYRVGDKGLTALSANTRLTSLSLWNCGSVSDGSVKALTTMTGLRQLEVGLTRITASGLDEIRKALPECKVTKKK
jgi:Leucine-rich repeat (LRR) protein